MKETFFVNQERIGNWLDHRRRSIFLLMMISFILLSLVLAVYYGIKVSKEPIFHSPETVMQHAINMPIVVAMLVIFVIIAFGIFFSTLANIKDESERDMLSITKVIIDAYELFCNDTEIESELVEVRVESSVDDLSRSERKLVEQLGDESDVKYWNRLPGRENLMIGVVEDRIYI